MRAVFAMVAAAAAMPLSQVAFGNVLVSENFDSRSPVGVNLPNPGIWTNPDTSIPGSVWKWVSTPPTGTAGSVTLSGPAGSNLTKSAVISEVTKVNDSYAPIILASWATGVTSNLLDVKFSLMTPLTNGQELIYIGNPWGVNMVTRIGLIGSSLIVSNGAGDRSIAGSISANTWTNIEMIANLNTKTYDIYQDGTLKNTGGSLAFSSFWNNGSVKQIQFDGDSSNTVDRNGPTLYVDNIQISAMPVPEPAMVSLLGLSSLMALVRRRRA